MDELLVDGGTVEFTPASGWAWGGGWNGIVSVNTRPHGMASEGKAVALAEDVERLASLVLGKSYTSDGFADAPGVVTAAAVSVDGGTLSPLVMVDGASAVTARTQGTFRITCAPSLKAGSPPVPDPAPTKSGTWRVERTGQTATRADR